MYRITGVRKTDGLGVILNGNTGVFLSWKEKLRREGQAKQVFSSKIRPKSREDVLRLVVHSPGRPGHAGPVSPGWNPSWDPLGRMPKSAVWILVSCSNHGALLPRKAAKEHGSQQWCPGIGTRRGPSFPLSWLGPLTNSSTFLYKQEKHILSENRLFSLELAKPVLFWVTSGKH